VPGERRVTAALAAPTRAAATPECESVTWVFDPWAERPRTAAASAVCAGGMCVLVMAAHLPFLVGAALAIFCVASLSPALTRIECRVDAAGAARRGLLGWENRRWVDVRRIEPVPAGVLLSAHAQRHWLDATRALVLPMPAARRAELLATLGTLRSASGR
jgi:hypothetical protein